MKSTRSRFGRLVAGVVIAGAASAGVLVATPAQALVGQEDAAHGRYPYYADLGGCGGAMIDPQWMITASHCASDATVGRDVRIGWSQDGVGSPIMTTALEVRKGPAAMDVALVRIAPRPNVPTVALSNQPVPVGGIYTSVAAGTGSQGRLGTAQFRVTHKDASYWNAAVSVTGAASTCHGDSGSPAIVATPEGDKLAAVTYGVDGGWACPPGSVSYSAAMSAPKIRDWIASVVPSLDFAASHRSTYIVRNISSGQVLDIAGGSTAVGGRIIQYPSTGGTNQHWTFAQKDGRTQLVSASSGLVLGVYGGAVSAGQSVVSWTNLGVADQKWTFTATDDGHYTIVNENSKLALAVPGGSKAAETKIIQYPLTGGDEQKWDVIDIR